MKKEIWITGIGTITTHGLTGEEFWNAVSKGTPCEKGSLAKLTGGAVYIDEDKAQKRGTFVHKKKSYTDQRRMFAIEAVGRALEDAGLTGKRNMGALVSCSKCTLGRSERWMSAVKKLYSYDHSSVFNVPIAGSVEIPCLYLLKKFGFRGPSLNVTAGCATGLMAIIVASRIILCGDADCMVAGGVEVIPEEAFYASYRTMNVLTDEYAHFRPYHRDRNGFFISEGSGVVVLESAESARKRGKIPYAIIEDWVALNDPSGMTSMDEQGSVISEMLTRLTDKGKIHIDYINTHGTGTKLNDLAETRGIKNAFGKSAYSIPCSATKPVTGHMLGATSAVEFIATVLSLRNNSIPPTIRLDDPDPECDLDFTPEKCVNKELERAITLSYGFGGPMAGILLRKWN